MTEQSLYERLGGVNAVAAVVDRFCLVAPRTRQRRVGAAGHADIDDRIAEHPRFVEHFLIVVIVIPLCLGLAIKPGRNFVAKAKQVHRRVRR